MTPLSGLHFFSRGMTLARNPKLRKYVWWPVAVSTVITISSLYFLLAYLQSSTEAMVNGLPEWLNFLSLILVPLIYLLGILVGVWFSSFFAVLIASPFLGYLAAATQKLTTGKEGVVAGSISSMLLREVRKLAYHLPRLIIAFLLTLIPVVNLVAPLIWLTLGAWMMTVQFVDLNAENEGLAFNNTLQQLKQQRGVSLVFGACVAFGMSIPLLNFVTIPVAVIGGTLLWTELQQA